jgi:hypothetical protein
VQCITHLVLCAFACLCCYAVQDQKRHGEYMNKSVVLHGVASLKDVSVRACATSVHLPGRVESLSPPPHPQRLLVTNLCSCVCVVVCSLVCRCVSLYVCQVVWAVGAESSSKEPDKAPRRLLKEVCLNAAAGHSGG